MDSIDFATDFTTVLAFVAYAAVMVGAVMNRRNGKTEVEKNKYFLPTAIISSVFIGFIALFQVYNILADSGD